MTVGYVRVSTVEQNEQRQVEALKAQGVEKWFMEKITGKNTERPKLKEMLNFVRDGDVVVIAEYSRIARSTTDLLRLVDTLHRKGVELVSLKEKLDTSTPQGKFMLTVFAALAELERETILERQREGIAIAKRAGKYTGRKPNRYDEATLHEVLTGIAGKTMTVTAAARRLGVTRATVYNILKRKGSGENDGC